jgi:hypothetical protein
MNKERKTQGRPIMLDDGVVDELVSLWVFTVASADGKREVTVDMLRLKARSKSGNRTLPDASHKRRIYFRRLWGKLVLTAYDIAKRKAFAIAYKPNGAPHMKHDKKYKYNLGACGIVILAGVGRGKVLV